MFRTVPLSIIRSFFTVHKATVYVVLKFYTFVKFQYAIYHCCVYSEKLPMMDRGTVRNM